MFDIVGSIIGLILVGSWLFPLIVLAIKLDTSKGSGPAFFRQERVGKGGRRFTIWKFRTMVDRAEDEEEALQANPNNETGARLMLARGSDDRVTRIGSFLRWTSLDELPQLINVLIGQMSLVGPRPLLPNHSQEFGNERLSVTPGITGLAQIDPLYKEDEVMELLDNRYVRSRSFCGDIRILFKTVSVVLHGRH
ncbi:MAG: sugar transferase [Candidatus Paceibacterota bacterium]